MQTILLAESDAVIRAFVLYCVFGAAVGGLLATAYWLWTRRTDTPQGFFRHPPSRATAAVIAAAATAAFIVIGARAELFAFHRIDIDAAQVQLHFALPTRTVTIARHDIGRVTPATTSSGNDQDDRTARLALVLRDGTRHDSVASTRDRIEAARGALVQPPRK